MLIEAERAPTSAGAKVTELKQIAPTASLMPHVFAWWNSERLVPLTPMLVFFKTALPSFENFTLSLHDALPIFWLPNVRVEGLSEACATPTPVPLRAAV